MESVSRAATMTSNSGVSYAHVDDHEPCLRFDSEATPANLLLSPPGRGFEKLADSIFISQLQNSSSKPQQHIKVQKTHLDGPISDPDSLFISTPDISANTTSPIIAQEGGPSPNSCYEHTTSIFSSVACAFDSNEQAQFPKIFAMQTNPNDDSNNDDFNNFDESSSAKIAGSPGTTAPEVATSDEPKKKRKKKSKKKGSAESQMTNGSVNCNSTKGANLSIPKPRNFLEAALYFSTITTSTVSLANALEPDVFFAPPLLSSHMMPREKYEAIIKARMARTGPEYEKNKAIQRRLSALFAVALTQTSSPSRSFSSINQDRYSSAMARTNFLKRAIGVFAVSLVDHLPPAMSTRLFNIHDVSGASSSADSKAFLARNNLNGSKNFVEERQQTSTKRLGLDDLRVPSPSRLAEFWQSLCIKEKMALIMEEIEGLKKGWINPKKTWCMCKYCKHRRLRLSDVFDLFYRAYFEELETAYSNLSNSLALESQSEQTRASDPDPSLTAPESVSDGSIGTNTFIPSQHQLKLRRMLYQSLSLVAEDILNTKAQLMLESLDRISRIFQESTMEQAWAKNPADPSSDSCECSQVDKSIDPSSNQRKNESNDFVEVEEYSVDINSHVHSHPQLHKQQFVRQYELESRRCDEYGNEYFDEENESCSILEDSEFDDFDFYADFNFVEDDEYVQMEGDLPVDEAQLPSALPPFYDIGFCFDQSLPSNVDSLESLPALNYCPMSTNSHSSAASLYSARLDHVQQGERLFYLFVNQIFQFHLVPALLEKEAMERQRRMLAEEEEAEKLAKEKEEARIQAKQRKKERQRAARMQKQQLQAPDSTKDAHSPIETLHMAENASEVNEEDLDYTISDLPKETCNYLPLIIDDMVQDSSTVLISKSSTKEKKQSKSNQQTQEIGEMTKANGQLENDEHEILLDLPPGLNVNQDIIPTLFEDVNAPPGFERIASFQKQPGDEQMMNNFAKFVLDDDNVLEIPDSQAFFGNKLVNPLSLINESITSDGNIERSVLSRFSFKENLCESLNRQIIDKTAEPGLNCAPTKHHGLHTSTELQELDFANIYPNGYTQRYSFVHPQPSAQQVSQDPSQANSYGEYQCNENIWINGQLDERIPDANKGERMNLATRLGNIGSGRQKGSSHSHNSLFSTPLFPPSQHCRF